MRAGEGMDAPGGARGRKKNLSATVGGEVFSVSPARRAIDAARDWGASDHDDLGANLDPAVEIDGVDVAHPDAA